MTTVVGASSRERSVAIADGALTGAQAAAAVGVSYRQLDYWSRLGLVRASVAEAQGSGTARLFSVADVEVLRVVGLLMGQGLGVTLVRTAVPLVRESDGCRWLVVGRASRRDAGRLPAAAEIAVVAEGHLEEALRTGGGSATVVDLAPAIVQPVVVEQLA